jgi:hypothetical protein
LLCVGVQKNGHNHEERNAPSCHGHDLSIVNLLTFYSMT